MTRALHGLIEAEFETEIGLEGTMSQSKARDIRGEALVDLMRQCNWIHTNGTPRVQIATRNTSTMDEFIYPEPTTSQLKEWTVTIKQQESVTMARRRNASNVSEQVDIRETESLTGRLLPVLPLVPEAPVAATDQAKYCICFCS